MVLGANVVAFKGTVLIDRAIDAQMRRILVRV